MDVTQRDEGSDNKGQVVVKKEERSITEICPIANNAALLEELDVAEGQVAELLEVAAEALDELSRVESLDSAKVEASTKQFLGLVSSLHGTLSSKATLIRDYTPYPRSIYGPRKELEILHEKARFLRSRLANLSREKPPTAMATSSATEYEPSGEVGESGTVAVAAAAAASDPTLVGGTV